MLSHHGAPPGLLLPCSDEAERAVSSTQERSRRRQAAALLTASKVLQAAVESQSKSTQDTIIQYMQEFRSEVKEFRSEVIEFRYEVKAALQTLRAARPPPAGAPVNFDLTLDDDPEMQEPELEVSPVKNAVPMQQRVGSIEVLVEENAAMLAEGTAKGSSDQGEKAEKNEVIVKEGDDDDDDLIFHSDDEEEFPVKASAAGGGKGSQAEAMDFVAGAHEAKAPTSGRPRPRLINQKAMRKKRMEAHVEERGMFAERIENAAGVHALPRPPLAEAARAAVVEEADSRELRAYDRAMQRINALQNGT